MANRFFDENKPDKESLTGKGPPTGARGPTPTQVGPIKTANWPGLPGRKRPDRSAGTKTIKQSMKEL